MNAAHKLSSHRWIAPLSLALFITACNKGGPSDENKIPSNAFEAVPTDVRTSSNLNDADSLGQIGESLPGSGQLIWLKKDFWLNRKIWISMGVERASLTGLAMSVMGYIPAEIEQVGNELILKRQSKGLFGGSTLAPDLVINSYPIMAENSTSILVDLSQPKSPYGLSTTGFQDGSSSSEELQPRLEYTKSSESTGERVSFTNVFVSKSPEALFDVEDSSAEALAGLDPYTLSATIRTDWLIETQSPHFSPLVSNDEIFGFFKNSPLVIENGTAVEEFVNHIDTSKQMTWTLSSNTPEEYRGAVTQGVLAWNSAFGKEALIVKQGEPNQTSFTNPETSNVVWDDNEAIGMAFANWRSHPYTGEIVQAQVYMSGSMWASSAKMTYKIRELEKKIREALKKEEEAARATPTPSPELSPAPEPIAPQSRTDLAKIRKELKGLLKVHSKMNDKDSLFQKRYTLGWNRALTAQHSKSQEFCMKKTDSSQALSFKLASLEKLLNALENGQAATLLTSEGSFLVSNAVESSSSAMGPLEAVLKVEHNPYPADGVSAEEFSKNVVRSVVMHEVGHTMGLRHNFIGSTGTTEGVRSASVMDYNDLVIDAEFTQPGSSDHNTIKRVYGSKEEKSSQKDIRFCTDELARAKVPGCTMFDFAENSLDGLRVQQETHLMIAQRMLMIGQTDMGLDLINNAISTVRSVVHFINFPTDMGAALTKDDQFEAKQKQAFELYQESKNMLGQKYPASLKSVYSQILIQQMASTVNERVLESAYFAEVLKELITAGIDESGQMELTTRQAAVLGLQNIQDMQARAALIHVRDQVIKRLEAAGEEITDVRMEDEEVLTIIQGILTKGYFKEPK